MTHDHMTSAKTRGARLRRRSVRGTAAALTTAALLAGTVPAASPVTGPTTGAAEARAYTVSPGASFGTPGGGQHEKLMLQHLANAPSGSLVRAATWSFNSDAYATALVSAARRGVKVRVLTSYRSRKEDAFKKVRAAFKNIKGSAIKAAKFSARGKDKVAVGNSTVSTAFHQKSFTFTRVGASKDVTVISSANMSTGAYRYQYTDTYTFVGNAKVRKRMNALFKRQWRDKPMAKPFRQWNPKPGGSVEFTWGPWNSPTMADPVLARINALPASGTVVRVAVSAVHGPRGETLAHALARIQRGGGKVYVLASIPFDASVRKILRQAGVTIMKGAVDPAEGSTTSSHYHHHKFMTAKYRSGSRTVHRTWMGSENWTGPSTLSDEIVVRVGARKTYRAYAKQFDAVADAVAARN